MNRSLIPVDSEPRNVFENIPAGTPVTVQNAGEGVVLLFEEQEANRGVGAKDDAIVLEGYPGFRAKTLVVGSDPLWAWCEKGSSVLALHW